jgi:predicted HTH transcriptional regulator
MADFITLTSLSQLQTLIADGIGESLTLDFKASPSLTRDSANVLELCKDVSAFANSAGGQIVYGIAEDKKAKTFNIDGGVTDPKITREWIDQILGSKIQPRMLAVRIGEIDLGGGGRAFVITVPPTQSGPHQAPDLKYYRRFEQQSVPMYERVLGHAQAC